MRDCVTRLTSWSSNGSARVLWRPCLDTSGRLRAGISGAGSVASQYRQRLVRVQSSERSLEVTDDSDVRVLTPEDRP